MHGRLGSSRPLLYTHPQTMSLALTWGLLIISVVISAMCVFPVYIIDKHPDRYADCMASAVRRRSSTSKFIRAMLSTPASLYVFCTSSRHLVDTSEQQTALVSALNTFHLGLVLHVVWSYVVDGAGGLNDGVVVWSWPASIVVTVRLHNTSPRSLY
jgi:tryptophan-rich sensory protein